MDEKHTITITVNVGELVPAYRESLRANMAAKGVSFWKRNPVSLSLDPVLDEEHETLLEHLARNLVQGLYGGIVDEKEAG